MRLAVGWHFYKQGVEKFKTRGWSSAGFLAQAKGPLGSWFRSFAAPLPDPQRLSEEGVIEVWSVFREEATTGYQYESPRFLAPLERELEHAQTQLEAAETEEDRREAQEAVRIAEERLSMFQRQAEEADEAFRRRQAQAEHFFRSHRADIDAYLRELAWLDSMKSDAKTGAAPFHQERIATREAEVRAKARELMAGIEQLDESLARDYYKVATPQQRQVGVLQVGRGASWVDPVVKWVILLVGVCLILGLFTRPAAVAGGLFLASVLAASGWPFWSGGNEETYKVAVELFAILTLAAVGAGRFAGLDFFLYALWAKFVGGGQVTGEQP
ncbi:MAG: hypothetical protein KY475_14335 [Planctomycetes bacterium]|nr:hypothetical protein [Planctomycetota bacterium]